MLKRAATSRAARNCFQSRVWISRRRDSPTLQSCNRVALVVVRAITFPPQDVPVFAGTYRACSRREGSALNTWCDRHRKSEYNAGLRRSSPLRRHGEVHAPETRVEEGCEAEGPNTFQPVGLPT